MKKFLTSIFLILALARLASAQTPLLLTGSGASGNVRVQNPPTVVPSTGVTTAPLWAVGSASSVSSTGQSTVGSLVLTSNTLATSGSGSSASVAVNGYGMEIRATPGSTWIFEGDSTAGNPNGAGLLPWDAILVGAPLSTISGVSGTSALGYFQSGVNYYIGATGGSVISNGTSANVAGLPCTGTGSWSGITSTINLSGTVATSGGYKILITGSNIPYADSCTVSGTIVTLSIPTTGGATNAALYFGGNNIQDRLPFYYSRRPASTGGTGGLKTYVFIDAGANCLRGNESLAQIESDITSVTGTLKAWGITPIVSPIMPSGRAGGNLGWWNGAEESIRAQYNKWILEGNISGVKVINLCDAFPGDINLTSPAATNWSLFDVNGIHPIGQANSMIASYVNSALSSKDRIYRTEPDIEDNPKEFTDAIQLDAGIQTTATSTLITPLLSATALQNGQTLTYWMGTQLGQFDSLLLSYYQDGSTADPANLAAIGIYNGDPLIIDGHGCVSIGVTGASDPQGGVANLYVEAPGNQFTFYGLNTNTGSTTTSVDEMPNLPSGDNHYGFHVGEAIVHDIGFDFYYSSTASSEWGGLNFGGTVNPPIAIFHSTQDTIFYPNTNTPTDNGYKVEVNGTVKLDGATTVGGLLTLTGTQISISGTTYNIHVAAGVVTISNP